MIAAVVLAAGASSRFRDQKLLAPVGTKPLVRVVVEGVLESAVDPVCVVLGREAAGVREALAGLPLSFVENPGFAQGMSTSVRCGISALPPGTAAAVIALGDQPLPTSEIIDDLISAFRSSTARIVAPSYAGRRGNPVLFAADLFPELLELEGDRGARGVIARHPEQLHLVEYPYPPPLDVDTPQDYQRLLEQLGVGG